jgi:hypothetical protein
LGLRLIKIIGFIGLGAGVLLLLAGFFLTPSFVANHFSPDGILEKSTIQQIQSLRYAAIILGILAALLGSLSLVWPSKVKRFLGLVSRSWQRFKSSTFLSDKEEGSGSSTSWAGESGFWARLLRADVFYIILIILYVIIFMFQIHLPPFESYPGWDEFWVDVRTAGGLLTLKQALLDGQLPAITPYEDFGFNFAGNTAPTLPLSPFNLLILAFSPAAVMVLRTASYFILGGVGAYLFLKLVTRDRLLSLLGGLTYISIPFVLNLHFYDTLAVFLLIPLFLLLIHHILGRPTPLKYLLFVVLCIIEFSAGDVHTLVILPVVVAVYSLLIGLGYYRVGFLSSIKRTVLLTFLCILSASFYILPLYRNLSEISATLNSFKDAGLYTGGGGMDLAGFLSFFWQNGFESLFRPSEGSGLLLYVPALFYFGIIMALAFYRVVFKENRRQIVIVIALLLLGLSMFLISVVFYILPGGFSSLGHGLLRGHINLIPFMVVLAGFVCFAAINRTKGFKNKIYIPIVAGALLIDLFFCGARIIRFIYPTIFGLPPRTALEGITSSNLISVLFIKDMWVFLPWLNLLFVILLFSHSLIGYLKSTPAKALAVGFAACAVLLPLLNISVHNELRASKYQVERSNPYRWEAYLERRAGVNEIIGPYDKNYRTMPASADVYKIGRGRNWKLIAETELHVQDNQKMLFSYRETVHPYTSLVYSTFQSRLMLSNWFPPISGRVPGNMDVVRLMGVKWVISADAALNSPDLLYRGEYVTRKAPPHHDNIMADGTTYIYEVRDPLPIAFLADKYRVVSLSESLKTIQENKEHPWSQGIVYLETEPSGGTAQENTAVKSVSSGSESSAEITDETFNSFEVNVTVPAAKYLVLSYLYRPNWHAYLGPEELKVYRAYGGFMAVEVPPGESTVRFRYTPRDVYLGLLLTALAFVLPLLAYITQRYGKRGR